MPRKDNAPAAWERIAREHELGTKVVDEIFWREYLEANPDVLHRFLADLYQSVKPAKDKPPTLDDLWEIVGPRYTSLPFGEAVHELLGKRSVRWLAREVHLNDVSLLRLLNGKREIVSIRDPKGSMARIEAIARALQVHPSYFAEWRRLWLMLLLDQAFETQPHLSIGIYQRFAGHQDKHAPRVNGR